MKPKWHFRQFKAGDNLSDPDFAKALFSRDAEAGVARSLVRESIQNSLDARVRRDGVVSVEFRIRTGREAAKAAAAADFLNGAWEHLHAQNSGLDDPPVIKDVVPFLVVEDFGTRGLMGDPEAWDPFESEKNPFFLFFRALGRSGKEGEDRGRWGVGKFVFPLASLGHCLLGYTVPFDRQTPLLMGRMVLKTHRSGGISYHPDGHWGIRGEGAGLVIPESASTTLESLRQVFSVRRTNEPGLSVVVPWLSDEVDGTAIRDAVIGEYFLPILRAELEVVVDENGQTTTIDADSVELLADAIDSPLLKARIALAIQAATWPDDRLSVTRHNPDIEWNGEAISDDVRASLIEDLDAGRPIGVRVPLTIRPKTAPSANTHFDMFIQYAEGLGRTRPLIVREGITIPEDHTVRLQDHIALIIVDHAPLAGFVGDAETPAHTELQNDLIKKKYTYGNKILQLLRTAPAALLRTLEQGAKEDDFSLLADLFPVTDDSKDDAPGRRRRPKPSPTGENEQEVPEIPTSKPRFRISKVEGGFTIRGTDDGELPSLVTIRFAYDVRRGNPLRKYHTMDFSLLRRELTLSSEGVEIIEKGDNRLVIAPVRPGFEISVVGFDTNRNVIVRADATSVEAEQ